MNRERTKENKLDLNSIITSVELRAIQLRYDGRSHQEITDILKQETQQEYKVDTLRKWFMRGGKLDEEYLEYARAENEQRRQVVMEEIKKLVPIIPIRLSQLLNRKKYNMFGAMVKDEAGNPVLNLDRVTIETIAQICNLLGLNAPKKIDLASDQPVQQTNIFQIVAILNAVKNLTPKPKQHEQHDAGADNQS